MMAERRSDPNTSTELASVDPENPLLDRCFRIRFADIRPDHVVSGVRAILERAQTRLADLGSDGNARTFENTIGELDRICQEASEALSPIYHLLSVAETPELRERFKTVLPEIARFWSRLYLDQDLWNQLRAFAGTSEAKQLKGIYARHLDKTLTEFRRAGADLSIEARERLDEIRVNLAKLEQKFSENVLDATASFSLHVTREERLDGLPPGPKSRFREAAADAGMEGWILSLDQPSFEAVSKYCKDRDLRQEMHEAHVSRCRGDAFDNLPLIPEILSLRQEMAELLGFPDFADYRLDQAMAKSGDAAVRFEEDLLSRTRPYWDDDLDQLREHAHGLGLPSFEPWDAAFVAESLRRERYAIDDESLRPFFPLGSVIDGLFALAEQVFGLTVVERDNPQTWHEDVRFYDVSDETGTWLGSFYTDWFPRKEKRQGAWMSDFLTGGPRSDGTFSPHLGFIAGNFSPPEDDKPALLTHREVQTTFHEFGHLLHHLTSRVPIPGRSGLNVAWDWVELPSQLMENWTWEEEALALFARHHETDDPLPGNLLDRMVSARRFMGGWRQMRQLSFGTLDLALHREWAPGPGRRTGPEHRNSPGLLAFVEARLTPFSASPSFAKHHILTTFTHLFSGGYAAGYYSYLWSEVLDADVFTRFKREGILNRDIGRAYVDAILSRGDSADPEELFLAFMGRGPDPEALLERNLGSRSGP